jgi:hypothetical protein
MAFLVTRIKISPNWIVSVINQ